MKFQSAQLAQVKELYLHHVGYFPALLQNSSSNDITLTQDDFFSHHYENRSLNIQSHGFLAEAGNLGLHMAKEEGLLKKRKNYGTPVGLLLVEFMNWHRGLRTTNDLQLLTIFKQRQTLFRALFLDNPLMGLSIPQKELFKNTLIRWEFETASHISRYIDIFTAFKKIDAIHPPLHATLNTFVSSIQNKQPSGLGLYFMNQVEKQIANLNVVFSELRYGIESIKGQNWMLPTVEFEQKRQQIVIQLALFESQLKAIDELVSGITGCIHQNPEELSFTSEDLDAHSASIKEEIAAISTGIQIMHQHIGTENGRKMNYEFLKSIHSYNQDELDDLCPIVLK